MAFPLLLALAGAKAADIGIGAFQAQRQRKRAHKERKRINYLVQQLYGEQEPEVTRTYEKARTTLGSRMAETGAVRSGLSQEALAKAFAEEATAKQRLKTGLTQWGEQVKAGMQAPAPEPPDLFGTALGALMLYDELYGDQPSLKGLYIKQPAPVKAWGAGQEHFV